MGHYAAGGPGTGNRSDADEALGRAWRQRTAQRVTDLREPQLRATGTSRISQLLADARQKRDDEAEAHSQQENHGTGRDDDHPGGARLRWWVPPLSGPQAPSDAEPVAGGWNDPPAWASVQPGDADPHPVVPPQPVDGRDRDPRVVGETERHPTVAARRRTDSV